MLIKAHAKVNLGLAVTEKRPDGFHNLDSLFARLELHDLLELEPLDKGIELEITGADLPAGRRNLVYLAAEQYLEQAGVSAGVYLHLTKHIPIAAGLGGGSSDAAAVLRALSVLYPSPLKLEALAKRLGADVPFFLKNLSLAHVTATGELLQAVEPIERHLVLANPGIAVSAKEAYAALEAFHPALELDNLIKALREHTEPAYINSLQAGVLALFPDIAEVLAALRNLGLQGVLLSGSGSTCFGLAASAEEASLLAERLQQSQKTWWVRASYML